MEEIYVNDEFIKGATNRTGPRSSDRGSHSGDIFGLVLLSVLLLAGLIAIGVHHHIADPSNDQLSSMTKERDQLKANLTEMTKKLHRLQNLFKQNKTCPEGWTLFSFVCYLLSNESGSWDEGRKDCRDRGADLVVIDSYEGKTFLSEFVKASAWIGLTDREEEGQWKWIDGTPATLTHWTNGQPDNGDGDPRYGEEDCAQINNHDENSWNDLKCSASLQWICEKIP